MCDWKQGGWRIMPKSKTGKSYRIIGGYKTVAIGASEEIAAYIADMHNARIKPGLACGEHHDSFMRGCRSDSKGAPGDDRPPGCGISTP